MNMKRSFVLAGLVAAGVTEAWPQARITAVVNAASFQSGLPSGGGLATILCSGLAPSTTAKPGTYVAPSFPLPYNLGEMQIVINNAPAPILAVVITPSGTTLNAQINFQVPLERNPSVGSNAAQGYLGVLQACGTTTTPVPPKSPWGGFFADANGYAVAQHASDYTPVTLQNPAHAGETIVAYANDFFPVWPPPPIGFTTPSQPLFLFSDLIPADYSLVESSETYLYLQDYLQPTCSAFPFMGCQSFTNTPALKVTFEGLAPGLVGVEQINFVVPANQKAGDWALFFNYGSCPDGSGAPGRCSTSGAGLSSPYVKLPVR